MRGRCLSISTEISLTEVWEGIVLVFPLCLNLALPRYFLCEFFLCEFEIVNARNSFFRCFHTIAVCLADAIPEKLGVYFPFTHTAPFSKSGLFWVRKYAWWGAIPSLPDRSSAAWTPSPRSCRCNRIGWSVPVGQAAGSRRECTFHPLVLAYDPFSFLKSCLRLH